MIQQFLSHVCTLRFTCSLAATVLTSVLTIFVFRDSDLCICYVCCSIILPQNQINDVHYELLFCTRFMHGQLGKNHATLFLA